MVLQLLALGLASLSEVTEDYQDVEENEEKESIAKLLLSMFESPPMICLLISHFLLHLGIFVTSTSYSNRAAMFGISRDKSTALLSIIGVSNFLGNIIFGKMLDHFRSRSFHMVHCVLLFNGADFPPLAWWAKERKEVNEKNTKC